MHNSIALALQYICVTNLTSVLQCSCTTKTVCTVQDILQCLTSVMPVCKSFFDQYCTSVHSLCVSGAHCWYVVNHIHHSVCVSSAHCAIVLDDVPHSVCVSSAHCSVVLDHTPHSQCVCPCVSSAHCSVVIHHILCLCN